MKPILLIDAFNLFSRHYIRHPGMSTLGHQTGGIVGFMNAVADLSMQLQPSAVYIVWEGGGSVRRKAIYSDYKSNRRPPRLNRYYEDDIPDSNENRMHQVKFLVEIFKHVPVCQLFLDGCEADDVIGYVCRNKFRGKMKVIASSDKDYYQLLDSTTVLYSWASKKYLGQSDVKNEYNITPTNFSLAKAICGDPSDNIPGVKGVGFKTLAKRFNFAVDETLSINDVIAECDNKINQKSKVRAYSDIKASEDLIKRNMRLMHLDVSNLAAIHVRKIEAVIDLFVPTRNKMKLMKSLIDEGLASYDAHDFYSSFNSI